MGRLRNRLSKSADSARLAARTIAAPLSGRDVAAGVGLVSTAIGIGLIYLPAALIAGGLLLTALAVSSEGRR